MASTTEPQKKGVFFPLRHLITLIALVAAIMFGAAPSAHAATAALSWGAPSTNSDGTPLTNLAGYRVYVGTAPGQYDPAIDAGSSTSYTVNNLSDGMTYYFAITAYNSDNTESAFSNEVSKICPVGAGGYVISATAGSGGSITPLNNGNVSSASSGGSTISSVNVSAGAGQSFSITPASGYSVAAVTVNGSSLGSVTSYSFTNVNANQTISATFAPSGSTGSATATPSAGSSASFAVNSGGTQYSDASGVSYATDGSYSGGSVATVTSAISGTGDQTLYQSERYGNFSYNAPLANGSYAVTLKFAETYWSAAGQRVFNVAANGQTVISNLDVFAKVGKNAAYDVTVPVTVTAGTLSLAFSTVVDNAKVCAIVVKPAATTSTSTSATAAFAANAGGASYTNAAGVSYAADKLYTGGTTATVTSAISGTSDQTLYQSERYGNFSYNIPLANGSYAVTLKFAETYWSAAGQRVFNVAANGQTVISNLDIFAKAGKNAAYDVTVPVTVTNGTLSLAFSTVVDNAKVDAILVQPASASTAAIPAAGVLFAGNAGGAAYVGAGGMSYRADSLYSGGTTASTTAAISGTSDQTLYQSERYGNFTYTIPVPNGSYSVVLKFAETYWDAAGQRVFSVAANGQTVISNLDVFAKAGKNAAYDVTVPVTVTNGTLTLAFTSQVDNAKVSAIVVQPSATGTVVYADNAGGASYLSPTGVAYLDDSRFTGGSTASTTAAISGTTDAALYQSERYGDFAYSIPVTNGSYAVTLKFAENYWTGAGQRVFNVDINGSNVISNLDIFSKVGSNAAYDVEIPVSVTNGTLDIKFTTVVDNAKVSAIAVKKL